MAQLDRMLMNHLRKAMSVASVKMLADTQKETANFYTGGNPKCYVRTGALGDTPKSKPLSVGSNQVSFEIYLDDSHGYSTGTFSMGDVLTNAEAHTAGIKGKPKFWANSKKRMEKTFNATMRSFFR